MNSPLTARPSTLTLPTVHLNGTSRRELVAGYAQAYEAVTAALDTLTHSDVLNARDYYVSRDPDAFRKAVAEHQSRVAKLQSVQAELLALYTHLDQQEAR